LEKQRERQVAFKNLVSCLDKSRRFGRGKRVNFVRGEKGTLGAFGVKEERGWAVKAAWDAAHKDGN